ncbi:MAG: hypothetical protein NTW86_26495 [Candidatus Sumerlaeota bacterium]|nr:hypothetical protein [Candidatus Sumerlaeota bacterium]
MNANPIDPVIEEIREVRRRISERFEHDPARLIAYYHGDSRTAKGSPHLVRGF